jgi:hypothetical protein
MQVIPNAAIAKSTALSKGMLGHWLKVWLKISEKQVTIKDLIQIILILLSAMLLRDFRPIIADYSTAASGIILYWQLMELLAKRLFVDFASEFIEAVALMQVVIEARLNYSFRVGRNMDISD